MKFNLITHSCRFDNDKENIIDYVLCSEDESELFDNDKEELLYNNGWCLEKKRTLYIL